LIGTTLLASVTATPLLSRLNLASENSAATWWPGILLALASIHAFDGSARWRRHAPARAWASIAIVLIVLSADEVGSIHERVEYFSEILGLHDQLAHLPFALVLLGLFGYAVHPGHGHQAAEQRALILIALGLFVSVAVQELIEEKLTLQSALARGIRAAIEEGTELAGILILLKVAMGNTAGLFAPGGPLAGRCSKR
jgi:hypothetical protein